MFLLLSSAFAAAPAWFGAPVAITPAAEWGADVKTGDFNGDGLVDVSVATATSGKFYNADRPFNIELSLTDGAGGFTHATVPTSLLSGYTMVTDAADLDGDGDADLVAGHASGFSVFFSDGSTLATEVDYTGLRVGALELGDVDADGDTDLLTLDDNGDLNYLTNDGFGSFTVVQALPTGASTVIDHDWDSIDLVDLDLDGALDVLVLVSEAMYLGTDPLVAYLNDGAGALDATAWTNAGPAAGLYDIDVGDIDGDGHVDLVYAGGAESIDTITWDGGYGAVTSWSISTYAYGWVLTGDVDGDGNTDAIGTVGFDIGVSLQDGGALVDQGVAYPLTTGASGWVVANDALELVDMNGDGCDDVVASLYNVGTTIVPATGPNCTGAAPVAWPTTVDTGDTGDTGTEPEDTATEDTASSDTGDTAAPPPSSSSLCAVAGPQAGSLALLALAGLGLIRRRR